MKPSPSGNTAGLKFKLLAMTKPLKIGDRNIEPENVKTLEAFQNVREEKNQLVYDYKLTLVTGETITLPQKEGYALEKQLKKSRK